MAEKGTITATFEPTLDVWRLLDGKPTEYVVVNPVVVEAKLRSGEVRRYPQEIRECITRCRDCGRAYQRGDAVYCSRHLRWGGNDRPVPLLVGPDGFCAWGKPREVD